MCCEIEKISNEFLYQIKRCEEYYFAWKELQNAYNLYNKQICVAQDFFSVVNEALLNSMMIELIKIYDYHRDAISMGKLLNRCQSDKSFINAFVDNEKKNELYIMAVKNFNEFLNMENTKNTLKNLNKRRDGFYMHNDGKQGRFYNIQSLIEEHPFSFEEMEALIKQAKDFCEKMYSLSAEKEWKPGVHQGNKLEHEREFKGLHNLMSMVKWIDE